MLEVNMLAVDSPQKTLKPHSKSQNPRKEKTVREERRHTVEEAMVGKLKPGSSDYESLRNARISENQARLASLGLDKTVSELRNIVASVKPAKTLNRRRSNNKHVYRSDTLRRSNRLKGTYPQLQSPLLPRRSKRLNPKLNDDDNPMSTSPQGFTPSGLSKGKENRPANAPFVSPGSSNYKLSSDDLSRRCDSKTRGSVYNPTFGICCHFCRQKKLCGEEDCKRCGDLDMEEPCMGKTDCSVCHSSTGVLCRACLKVRYGEEMEEVRQNKEWMCPHCIEEKGIRPYWICNSSLCLKKRKIAPTGIAIFEAREMGYKSVAHLLMNRLQNKFECK